jgi:hypothetical protein
MIIADIFSLLQISANAQFGSIGQSPFAGQP